MLLGFLIGLTGVGGGVLLVPVLNVFFELDPATAVGTASIYVTLTKIYACFEHVRIKNVAYKHSLYFMIGAIPTVLFAAGFINIFLESDQTIISSEQFQDIMKNCIVVIVFLSVALMLLELLGKPNFLKKNKEKKDRFGNIFAAGTFIGFIMGATGVGGGVLILPTFNFFSTIDQKKIIGSSIFIALILSFITAIIYSKGGQMDIPTALGMSIGSMIGVPLATKVIKIIPVLLLKYIVLALITFSAVLMLYN